MERIEALDKLRARIGGCFGTADGIFAGHAMDEKRAKELRKEMHEIGVSLGEVQDIVAGHLHRKGFNPEHIKEQFDEASDFFGEKLS